MVNTSCGTHSCRPQGGGSHCCVSCRETPSRLPFSVNQRLVPVQLCPMMRSAAGTCSKALCLVCSIKTEAPGRSRRHHSRLQPCMPAALQTPGPGPGLSRQQQLGHLPCRYPACKPPGGGPCALWVTVRDAVDASLHLTMWGLSSLHRAALLCRQWPLSSLGFRAA